MRFSVLAALAAVLLLGPSLGAAQDVGPDTGMAAESRAAAQPNARAERTGQPTLS